MKNDIVTVAKGIGIILMVGCHAGINGFVSDFIYMFHMPLFFLLSGFCFKDKYLTDFRTFSLKRVKGLYWPFVKWGIVFLLLHNLFYSINIYNDQYGYSGSVSHLYSFHEIVSKGIFSTILFTSSEQLLGGYWFLIQLFWASIIGFVTIRYVRNNWVGISVLLSISVILSCVYGKNIPYTCIGSLSFMSAAFFVTGYKIKCSDVRSHGCMGLICLTGVVLGTIFWKANMQQIDASGIIPYFVTAVLGTLMIMQISRLVATTDALTCIRKPLIYVGNHTLEILTWHFISFKIVNIGIILLEGRPMEMLAMFPVINDAPSFYWIIYTIVGICFPLGMTVIVQRIADLRLDLKLKDLLKG